MDFDSILVEEAFTTLFVGVVGFDDVGWSYCLHC
jgi:hypothetical protein